MIPTELFIAICKYLHPADLLNLSRTCHNYRDILYYLENETTKEIWKFSRSKFMPFLPNPKKINEILYIRCVLEKKCQFCMKRTGHRISYSRLFCQPQYLAELPFEIITDYDRLLGYQSCYYYWEEDVDVQLNEYNGIPNEKKDKCYKQKNQAGQQKMLDVCIRDIL
ncbi:hypothetical protein GLOIN_2v1630152 [Rhizophagus irregularis DAOM 181602=DAOM 197198]|uniref:Uncharacterized protein n=1 Tax=Rhizophagus irregularis (strain DAOM 181602 / DAOM 197198 / MUCL 43194) TaxID=747089 RepID=U9SRQ5_RHIID|nr:hypothetical protein GLOIN_2v1630152 [Rhizophagus irregularis DAOM 181602=DAOM 197198]